MDGCLQICFWLAMDIYLNIYSVMPTVIRLELGGTVIIASAIVST